MKRLVILLILISIVVVVLWLTGKKEPVKEKTTWPINSIRSQVTNLAPADIKEIVFDGQYKTKKLKETLTETLTETEEITPFIAGLKEAVYPWDPRKGLPNDNMMSIKLILKDGRTLGPWGFSIEKASHAFGKTFAEAWNKTFTQKISID